MTIESKERQMVMTHLKEFGYYRVELEEEGLVEADGKMRNILVVVGDNAPKNQKLKTLKTKAKRSHRELWLAEIEREHGDISWQVIS